MGNDSSSNTSHGPVRATAQGGSQDCTDIEILLSGYLDGELTQQQAQRVRVHLENCAHCQSIHQDLESLQARMQQLSYPKSDEALLDALEKDLLARSSAWVGWGLLLLGALILGGFSLYGFFVSAEVPVLVRICYALFMLGGTGLFLSVLRQRLLVYKNDKYRKVKL